MDHPKGVLVIRDFLEADLCQRLRLLYDAFHRRGRRTDYNRRPVVSFREIPEDRRHDFHGAASRVMARLREHSGLALLPEAMFLARIMKGDLHALHRDNCQPDGEANHTPQRDYSALVYLGSDFTGGEIDFPGRGTVKPREGMLVAFPSGHEFPHEVRRVRSGSRYSMPVWATLDPESQMAFVRPRQDRPRRATSGESPSSSRWIAADEFFRRRAASPRRY